MSQESNHEEVEQKEEEKLSARQYVVYGFQLAAIGALMLVGAFSLENFLLIRFRLLYALGVLAIFVGILGVVLSRWLASDND